MSELVRVPDEHALMQAWNDYQAGANYSDIRRWALQAAHVDGSLWHAFVAGWTAAGGKL